MPDCRHFWPTDNNPAGGGPSATVMTEVSLFDVIWLYQVDGMSKTEPTR